MKKFILNLRKFHRAFTIPMVILMILKISFTDSSYDTIVTRVVSIGMLFMVISGLLIYLYTTKIKMEQKKKKQVARTTEVIPKS